MTGDTQTPVYRFAPSPNGRLHLGHALSALINDEAARRTRGRFLVRIEDVDQGRARPDLIAAILDDLTWLDLDFSTNVLRQSDRGQAYQDAVEVLTRLGLVYPAFLSRKAIRAIVNEKRQRGENWPDNPDGTPLYPGSERDWTDRKRRAEMASGRPYALRLDMNRCLDGLSSNQCSWQDVALSDGRDVTLTDDPAIWGDIVLIPKDAPASYHLSVVVDDDYQDITHIIRGRDLEPATALHRLLQTVLNLKAPLYSHHRLILDENGEKLSKSDGAKSLAALRAQGATPDEIRNLVGFPSDFAS